MAKKLIPKELADKMIAAGSFVPLADTAAPSKPTGSALQAFVEGFGKQASLGNLPSIQAAIEKITPSPSRALDKKLKAEGFKIEQPESFLDLKNQNIARQAQLSQDRPIASALGSVAGFGATMAVPFGVAGKVATMGGKIAQGAKAGAVMAGLSAPEKEESVTEGIGKRAIQSGVGAVLGGAAPVVIEKGIIPLAEKGVSRLGELAKRYAFSSVKPIKGKAAKALIENKDLAIGEALLKTKALPWFGSPQRLLDRISERKEAVGEKIGELLESTGDKKIMRGWQLANFLKRDPEIVALGQLPGQEGAAAKIGAAIKTISKKGALTLKDMHKLRRQIDESINYNKAIPDFKAAQEGLFVIGRRINDIMDYAVNTAVPEQLKGGLKKAFSAFSKLAAAEKMAIGRTAAQAANRGVSLTDTIVGSTAGVGGAMLGGGSGLATAAIAGALGNKFFRAFGDSLRAKGSEKMSEFLARLPQNKLLQLAREKPAILAPLFRGLADVGSKDTDIQTLTADPEMVNFFRKSPDLVQNIKNTKLRDAVESALHKR